MKQGKEHSYQQDTLPLLDLAIAELLQYLLREAPEPSEDYDPLAQTFRVSQSTGIFATKVDLYFETKPTNGVPVWAQLRPVVNGYPSSTEIYPGTTQYKGPSAITTSTDATAATTFTFDEPVYLPAGEHCVVVGSDSNKYRVYIAEVYKFKLGTTETRINSQPTLGSLFKSQNASTWEPSQTQDLTFVLHRANFVYRHKCWLCANGER